MAEDILIPAAILALGWFFGEAFSGPLIGLSVDFALSR